VWMRSSWSNSDNDELATVLPRLADPALLTRRSIAPSRSDTASHIWSTVSKSPIDA
jgi:hypothetical protein